MGPITSKRKLKKHNNNLLLNKNKSSRTRGRDFHGGNISEIKTAILYFRDSEINYKELAKLLHFSLCACIVGFDIALIVNQGSLLEFRVSHQQDR
ncbi:unnamed protein product [Citrullus colocynthis]|uniref:Uncharacterized protein n=1 Tax=Citrullus colocynthis TaxID=252529 RepID=A0ABP0YVT7_9ROSI